MAYFSGRVLAVFFKNEDQCFNIVKMTLDGTPPDDLDEEKALLWKEVVVKGYVPGVEIKPGVWFGFQGKWINDPKYGLQISVTKAPVIRDHIAPEVISEMLTSDGQLPDRVVRRLTKVFGEGLFKALQDTDEIKKGLGVGVLEAEFLVTRWKAVINRLKVLETLNNMNLPRHKVGEIWATFGDETEELLTKNPWALVDIDGIPWADLDNVAKQMGIDLDNSDRRVAAVVHATRRGRQQGDMFLVAGQILTEVGKLLPGTRPKSIAVAIKDGHQRGNIVLDRKTRTGMTAIYDPWMHRTEEESSLFLRQRIAEAVVDGDDVDLLARVGPVTRAVVEDSDASDDDIVYTALNECADSSGFQLSDKQAQGLYNALMEPVSILTGLPGTGKSTSMKVLVRLLQSIQVPFLMVAPTGIAAKRLATVSKHPASTIHRAFGARGSKEDDGRKSTYKGIVGSATKKVGHGGRGEIWEFGPDNPHPADVVIVDEFSMVDQHLMWRILTGTKLSTRLVMIGDAAQLPSVGPGNVLRDLIKSEAFPTVNLTKIFRQEDTSAIVHAAHAIYRGEVPATSIGTDFALAPVSTDKKVLNAILKVCERLYKQAKAYKGEGIGPTFQVLSPRHGGTVGVTNLNNHIRARLNPRSKGVQELKVGVESAREGDRVMVVKNNYDLGVYNGDVGKIRRISRKHKLVIVEVLDSPPRHISFNLVQASSHLRLAYACTVHKYQGLEVDTVVMPLVMGFGRQLQRNLLYTAITRARQRVILVGSRKALAKAVENNKEDTRNTLFVDRLVAAFSEDDVAACEIAVPTPA